MSRVAKLVSEYADGFKILSSKSFWSTFWRYWSDDQLARRFVKWANRVTGKRNKLPSDTSKGHWFLFLFTFGYPVIRIAIEVIL